VIQLRLQTKYHHVDLVANESATNISFQVVGPASEAAFVEEIICQRFGSLRIPPIQLFDFLQNDAWINEFFSPVCLIRGSLDFQNNHDKVFRFHDQPLGTKLVKSGILSEQELEELLIKYQPFSKQQRFGEFLRLNLAVSSEIMNFLLDPLPMFEDGFNEKRLGERLVELGLITNSMLDHALQLQRTSGTRLGEILQDICKLSPEAADFFSKVRVAENGEVNI